MTTVNGEDDVPVCLDACSDTWEEEFFDNLGQEDQGKEQDEEAILSLEDIQLFLESRGRLQDAMQVGNFMDNLSAVQIATANRPLFMISFNSNSSLFRVSFNFVNTCYFFVICSFSPKKHHYKEKLRDGTNLSTRTEHPVPNAVTPRRFHCTYFVFPIHPFCSLFHPFCFPKITFLHTVIKVQAKIRESNEQG